MISVVAWMEDISEKGGRKVSLLSIRKSWCLRFSEGVMLMGACFLMVALERMGRCVVVGIVSTDGANYLLELMGQSFYIIGLVTRHSFTVIQLWPWTIVLCFCCRVRIIVTKAFFTKT